MTVSDAARAQLVDWLVREEWLYTAHAEPPEETAARFVDALLVARSSTICEKCGGDGKEPGYIAPLGHPDSARCMACDGSGTVPGGPVLLDLVAEQVGERCREGKDWALHDGPCFPPGVPVYVAREST